MKNIQDLLSRITKNVCMHDSHNDSKKKTPSTKARMTMELLLVWKNIVGDALSKYAKIEKITFDSYSQPAKGTVHIIVPHHAFGFEIQMQQGLFLQKIHHYLGNDHINFLKTRVSPSDFKSLPTKVPSTRLEPAHPHDHLLCLEPLQDESLKEALSRLGQHMI